MCFKAKTRCFRCWSTFKRVYPYSPAYNAGIKPFQEYILGTPLFYYNDFEQFQKGIKKSVMIGRKKKQLVKIPLAIYSSRTEEVRFVDVEFDNQDKLTPIIGVKLDVGLLQKLIRIVGSESKIIEVT